MAPYPRQTVDPLRTTWHITWGTYGTRLHGGSRATVDRDHNQCGEEFIERDQIRYELEKLSLKFDPVRLSCEQRVLIEEQLPAICKRGGWGYRVCAAAEDHIHLLCDAPIEVHGEKVRRLAKRWLGELLSAQWPLVAGATRWAEEGSNKAIHNESYLNNAFGYIAKQRATELAP